MDPQKEQELKDALDAIRNLPPEDRDKILRAAEDLKTLTLEDLAEITSSPAFAGCGPCDPCGPQGEIGIEPGY